MMQGKAGKEAWWRACRTKDGCFLLRQQHPFIMIGRKSIGPEMQIASAALVNIASAVANIASTLNYW